ncbi:hypothetical protein FA95DRAFT_1467881, partial [Auriscalpium vulgare]
ISRLPPEILGLVFSFEAEMDPPRCYEDAKPNLGWINVTHVCRRWRYIATDHSSLWARIEFTLGERWVEEMFRRARTSPLIIELDSAAP